MDGESERGRRSHLLTTHVFDKVRALDMTLTGPEQLLGTGEMIEEFYLGADEVKELLLVLEWARPLHVVLVVDGRRGEQRVVTVYEPDRDRWVGRLQDQEALMRCVTCDNGERRPTRRAKVAERDGRVALVLGVPVEVCDACDEVWLSMDVAKRLDELFRRMLSSDLEVATRHYDAELATAA